MVVLLLLVKKTRRGSNIQVETRGTPVGYFREPSRQEKGKDLKSIKIAGWSRKAKKPWVGRDCIGYVLHQSG